MHSPKRDNSVDTLTLTLTPTSLSSRSFFLRLASNIISLPIKDSFSVRVFNDMSLLDEGIEPFVLRERPGPSQKSSDWVPIAVTVMITVTTTVAAMVTTTLAAMVTIVTFAIVVTLTIVVTIAVTVAFTIAVTSTVRFLAPLPQRFEPRFGLGLSWG